MAGVKHGYASNPIFYPYHTQDVKFYYLDGPIIHFDWNNNMSFFYQRSSTLSKAEQDYLRAIEQFERGIPNQRWRARFKASNYDNVHTLFVENQHSKNAVRLTCKDGNQFKLELLSRNPIEVQYVGTPFRVDLELKVTGSDLAVHIGNVTNHLWHAPSRFNNKTIRLDVTNNPNALPNPGRIGGPLFAGIVKSIMADYANNTVEVTLDNTKCKFTVPIGEEGLSPAARTGGYFIYNLGHSASLVKHLFVSEPHAVKMFKIENLYIGRTVGLPA